MQDELKGRAGEPRVNVPAGNGCVARLHCSIDQDWSSGSVPVTLNKPLNSKKFFFHLQNRSDDVCPPRPRIPASQGDNAPRCLPFSHRQWEQTSWNQCWYNEVKRCAVRRTHHPCQSSAPSWGPSENKKALKREEDPTSESLLHRTPKPYKPPPSPD